MREQNSVVIAFIHKWQQFRGFSILLSQPVCQLVHPQGVKKAQLYLTTLGYCRYAAEQPEFSQLEQIPPVWTVTSHQDSLLSFCVQTFAIHEGEKSDISLQMQTELAAFSLFILKSMLSSV